MDHKICRNWFSFLGQNMMITERTFFRYSYKFWFFEFEILLIGGARSNCSRQESTGANMICNKITWSESRDSNRFWLADLAKLYRFKSCDFVTAHGFPHIRPVVFSRFWDPWAQFESVSTYRISNCCQRLSEKMKTFCFTFGRRIPKTNLFRWKIFCTDPVHD